MIMGVPMKDSMIKIPLWNLQNLDPTTGHEAFQFEICSGAAVADFQVSFKFLQKPATTLIETKYLA